MGIRIAILIIVAVIAIVVTVIAISKFRDERYRVVASAIALILWLLVVGLGWGTYTYSSLMSQRQLGLDYEAAGKYENAYDTYLQIYNKMGDWSDICECISRVEKPVQYTRATELYKHQEYLEALEIFLSLEDYGNSKAMAEKCMRAYSETN